MLDAKTLNPQYVTDENGEQTVVILPIGAFPDLLEDIEDLAAIAERREELTIPHEQVIAQLKRDGFLPNALAKKEDRNYLQGLDEHSVGYSREIRTVGRDFIARHENGYPVSKPPRINHHGIDNAFLEKASEVWYFHARNWFKLPGSD
jgi:hypothetical protein